MKNRKKNKTNRLGIDFGKVIMEAVVGGRADTSFLGSSFEQAMSTPASEGAIEAVTALVEAFQGAVWIVSKCGPSVQNKTRGWLKHNQFYRQTGLDRENLRFCLKRNEKTPICRQLGITHFIDDRLDVLEPMIGVVPHLYLFGEQPAGVVCPEMITHVGDWRAVLDEILPAAQVSELAGA